MKLLVTFMLLTGVFAEECSLGDFGVEDFSDKVVVTNTLPLPPEKQIDKIEVLSVSKIIADAIDAVFEDTSVSEIFGGANQT